MTTPLTTPKIHDRGCLIVVECSYTIVSLFKSFSSSGAVGEGCSGLSPFEPPFANSTAVVLVADGFTSVKLKTPFCFVVGSSRSGARQNWYQRIKTTKRPISRTANKPPMTPPMTAAVVSTVGASVALVGIVVIGQPSGSEKIKSLESKFYVPALDNKVHGRNSLRLQRSPKQGGRDAIAVSLQQAAPCWR